MVVIIKKSAPVLIGIFIIVSMLSAQSERFDEAWRWAEFTTASGLPSDNLTDLVETNDGIVWVVSMSGLAWYDGFKWNFIDSTKGLPTHYIETIRPFGAHQLILRCNRKLYVGDRDGFSPLPLGDAFGIAPLPPSALLLEKKSSIFLFKDGTFGPFIPSSNLTNGKTIDLWDTKGGSVWANLSTGLYRFETQEWKQKIPWDSAPGVVKIVAENGHGTGLTYLTFPFEKRGLWEWFNGSKPVRNIGERPDNIKMLDISDDDEAIVAYQSGEVKIRQHGRWSLLPLMNSDIRDIVFVKFRANRDLWIGTEHGLFLYKRSSSRWRFIKHDSPDLRNSINEILKTHDGNFWVATSDGLEVHHPDSSVKYITHINAAPLYVVTGLAEDNDGGVWISSGSSFNGVYHWDGMQWTHFDVSMDHEGVRIHKIRKDRKGRLWFLGVGKNFPGPQQKEPGAFLYTKNTFRRWGEEEGLLNGRVYAFAEGRDGSLWFGTGGGLNRWKPRSAASDIPNAQEGAWTHWTLAQGLHTNRVFTLAIDSTGRLWFGDPSTLGVGVGYIDQNDSVQYMTVADGLVNDFIWDLRVDRRGTLWVATGGGLCSYSNGRWSTFDHQSGLLHAILWPVLPLDREVYVGTQGEGIAVLNIDESNTPEPQIELETPTMKGKNILLHWKAYAYWGELNPSEIVTRFRLQGGPWSAWSRMKEYTLVDLDPGEYIYQVQARGLFGNYLTEGATSVFTMPLPMYLRPIFLLPTGFLSLAVIALGVVLLLRKRNHDIALRKSEEKFRTVTEMTSSAIFIYQNFHLLFVNSGAENLTGYTQRELLAKSYLDLIHPSLRGELQREELARTGDTSIPHRYESKIITRDGEERWVDCTSGWIRFQGRPVRIVTAFEITERKRAEEKLRSLASELSLTEERERRRMATYLHDVIGQTLALSKMKIRGLQKTELLPVQQQFLQDIREFIDQSITNTQTLTFELCPPILYELSFEAAIEWLTDKMHTQHDITIEFRDDHQPKHLAEDVRILLFQAVREVLINVVKHAEAKRACVALSRVKDAMQIDITDDGIGFDATRKKEHGLSGGGFGLFNIRERLTYLGGHLEIISHTRTGTRVTITAPLQSIKV